jgi:hypothetical protein
MRRVLAWTCGILASALIAAIAFVEFRNRSGVGEAEAEFAAHRPAPIGDFGTTRTLSILPLIDWHTSGSTASTRSSSRTITSTTWVGDPVRKVEHFRWG